MTARRLTVAGLVSLYALVGTLALAVSPAGAAQIGRKLGTFGGASSTVVDPYPLSNPQGVAVDEETEDVYVADAGNHRVEKFSVTGQFLLAFGGGVGGPGVDVCGGLVACVAGVEGSAPGDFTTPEFVAVDSDPSSPSFHDVYVADTADNVVSKFSPEGKLQESWGAGGQLNGSSTGAGSFGSIAGIAVGTTGTLYVLSTSKRVFEFPPSGAPAGEVPLQEPYSVYVFGLGVNATGGFWVNDERFIQEFGPAGELILEFNLHAGALTVEPVSGELYWVSGETVNTLTSSVPVGFEGAGVAAAAGGDVFLSNAGAGRVYRYGIGVAAPDAEEGLSVSDVTATSATLNAGVEPGGEATSCVFEYEPVGGVFAPVPGDAGGIVVGEEGEEGDRSIPVSFHVQGLQPGTVYEFRVSVSNSVGSFVSESSSFATEVAGGGLVLPDGRQWELVSPADKHGALLEGMNHEGGVFQAAVDGDAMTYLASAPTEGEPPGYTEKEQVLSTRGPDGWVSRDISLPHEHVTPAAVGEGQEYVAFSEDLSLAVVQPHAVFEPALSTEASEQTPYLRTNFLNGNVNEPCTQSCYRPLVTGKPGYANVTSGAAFGGEKDCTGICGPEFDGATPDLSHIALRSEAPLLAGSGEREAYEWDEGRLSAGNHLPKLEGGVDSTSRVSSDGRWSAFMSDEELTGYDNRDANSGKPAEEVFLENTSTKHVVCASCNPTGARPVGREAEELMYGEHGLAVNEDGPWAGDGQQWIAANVPGWTPYTAGRTVYQSRYLSDSGRLFFDSNDALVPKDVNGNEDVYEYEPVGVGSCTTSTSTGSGTYVPASGGCVSLISSGQATGESAFLDASETGGDVFFLTTAKLAPQDVEGGLSIFDARECSSQTPCYPAAAAVPPPCDTGDACKPAPTPQPAIYGSPSSATFSGAGDITPPAPTPKQVTKKTVNCGKGSVRNKKGKCVKKSKKKKNKAEKSAHINRGTSR
jgi:NHL repeat-containing protein